LFLIEQKDFILVLIAVVYTYLPIVTACVSSVNVRHSTLNRHFHEY